MDITLSVDDEILQKARCRAEALGTNINQLLREYLVQLADKGDPQTDAQEFVRLSRMAKGNSQGWKFNREELYDIKE